MTATDGTYNPDRGRMGRLIMLLGHHAVVLEPVLYALTWVSVITTTWWMEKDTPLNTTVSWLGVACIVGTLTTMAAQHAHDSTLCLLDVAESPLLNPQAAVDKHRKQLDLFHNRSRGRIYLTVGALPMVVMVLGTQMPAGNLLIKITGTVAAVAGVAAMTQHGYATRIHRKLYPWCKRCHPGGGGDTPASAPTPDPVGTANR